MNETTTSETTAETPIEVEPPRTAHETALEYEALIDAPPTEDAPPGDLPTRDAPPEDPPTEDAPPEDLPSRDTANEATPSQIAPSEEAAQPRVSSSPHTRTEDSLRLRMKIWTDPKTHKRYLMPAAFMRDVINGQPFTTAMYAYAMSNDETKLVTLTALEWNSLPFYYFQEDGWAPRAGERPVDTVP